MIMEVEKWSNTTPGSGSTPNCDHFQGVTPCPCLPHLVDDRYAFVSPAHGENEWQNDRRHERKHNSASLGGVIKIKITAGLLGQRNISEQQIVCPDSSETVQYLCERRYNDHVISASIDIIDNAHIFVNCWIRLTNRNQHKCQKLTNFKRINVKRIGFCK